VTRARDLSAELGDVRDQGPRSTCLVFAATAVHEQARRQRRADQTKRLGEEVLYWLCKRIDGDHDSGTYPRSATAALRSPGQSPDALWPYDAARDDTAADYAAPAAAQDPAQMRRASMRGISRSLEAIRSRVSEGHAVLLAIDLWPQFFDAPDGALGTPAVPDLIGDGHAVVAVGYDDDRRQLLIRNSWGRSWGRAGHGHLPYDALAIVTRSAWTIDDDLDP
jgi:C1A family cysteine protease